MEDTYLHEVKPYPGALAEDCEAVAGPVANLMSRNTRGDDAPQSVSRDCRGPNYFASRDPAHSGGS
jgi:hypothetical protein